MLPKSSVNTLTTQDWETLRKRGWTGSEDVNAVDEDGNPPLFFALMAGQRARKRGDSDIPLARKILENGAHPNAINHYGENAWSFCLDLLEGGALLHEYGTDINQPDGFGVGCCTRWIIGWSNHRAISNSNGLWALHDDPAYRLEVLDALFLRFGLKMKYTYENLDEEGAIVEEEFDLATRLMGYRIIPTLSNQELLQSIQIKLDQQALDRVVEKRAPTPPKAQRM